MRPSAKAVAVTASTLALFSGLLAVAGPLAPSAGPIGATYKTLTDVEPRIPISQATTPGNATSTFRITQPGSYYLTGNVTGEAGKAGIDVAAAYVTIDLNGYQLKGVAGSLKGVWVRTGSVLIRNGNISSWGDDGVGYDGGASNIQVHSVNSQANGGAGIAVGAFGEIRNCRVFSNAQGGYRLYSAGHLLDSIAVSNTGVGVLVGNSGCIVRGCVVSSSTGDGYAAAVNANIFENCIANFNGGDGFDIDQSMIHGCTAASNSGFGFVLGNATQASSCSASINALGGFTAGAMCLLDSNSADSNGAGTVNRYGFTITGTGTRVVNNYATNNVNGFLVSSTNAYFHGNTASNNATYGFAANGSMNGLYIGNTSSGNGTAFAIGGGNGYGAVMNTPGANFSATNPAANYAP